MVQATTYDTRMVASRLRHGGIVLLPTDTVYGLAVLPTCSEAVDRLYALKERPHSRPLPVMVHAQTELLRLGVNLPPAALRLLQSPFVPGPLTLALGLKDTVPPWLNGREEVAIRIPNDEYLLAILQEIGPLFVTSANSHGSPTQEDVHDILLQLKTSPDLVIDGGRRGTVASTLVNCHTYPPRIEREGCVSRIELAPFL